MSDLRRRRCYIRGTRIHYRVAGRGARATPAVCIPEPGSHSATVAQLVGCLARERLAFAIDLPGHGFSGNPGDGRVDPAWWLNRWLDKIGFERCHLVTVGDSIGVALDLVQRGGGQTVSLTCISPPPLRTAAPLHRTTVLADRTVHSLMHPIHLGATAAATARSAFARSFVQNMRPYDLLTQLERLPMGMTVVRGTNDSHIPASEANEMAARTGGTYIEIPSAGRNAFRTHPAATAAALSAAWKQVEATW